MFLLNYLYPLFTIPGSRYTTSAPDHSNLSVSDFLVILLVMIAVIGALLYISSISSKRRRKRCSLH